MRNITEQAKLTLIRGNKMSDKPINLSKILSSANFKWKIAPSVESAKETEGKISFSKQLDKYISEQAKKVEPQTISKKENLSETQKLDEYIAQQARKYEAQKTKPKAIEITSPEAEAMAGSPEIAKLIAKYPYFNLGLGSRGGAVKDLQKTLNSWLPKLRLRLTGRYGYKTHKAVTLFKAIHNTGTDGRKIDLQTAKLLTGVKDGTFWKFNPDKADQYRPEKTIAGEILHKAAFDLGIPYRLGGDGNYTTDCAMLTKRALIKSGAVDQAFKYNYSTRLADIQYRLAENRRGNLQLVSKPEPGDLIFFKNTSYQASIAYKRITHTGIYVGENVMLAASPSYGGVTLQNITDINPRLVAGFARAIPKPATVASRQIKVDETKT